MQITINKNPYYLLASIILALLAITVAMPTVSATGYYISTNGNDSNDGLSTSTYKQSISNATTIANSGDTIYLSNGIYKGLKNKGIVIDKSLSFIGESKENTIIDAEKNGRMFTVLPDCTVNFINITFRNGFADDGGAIYNKGGFLTISDCNFEKNTATTRGGAVFSEWSYGANIENSKFSENTAGVSGGAVYNFYGDNFSIKLSQFQENFANNAGGAVFNEYGNDLEIQLCEFIKNTAKNCGGAIYTFYGNRTTITESVFTSNKAIATSGGAIFNERGANFTVAGCEFRENTAGIYGGAIDTFHGDKATFSQNIFVANKAIFGGAIFNEHGDELLIENCEFNANVAEFWGAALYNFFGDKLTIISPVLLDNTAEMAEFLFNEWSHEVIIKVPSDIVGSISYYIYTNIPNEITIISL